MHMKSNSELSCLANEMSGRPWPDLGLGIPVFTVEEEHSRELHVVKLTKLDDDVPHLTVYSNPFRSLSEDTLRYELRHAIAHAMGHAFVRSLGVPYDHNEENAVERYARLGDTKKLFEYMI